MRKRSNRPSPLNDGSISLNKYISDTGFCSRREADDYIAMGRVTINENVALPGNRVYEGDNVELDGEPLIKKVKTIYLAFNKPKGITTTTDQRDKTSITSYIGFPQRIFPVGRLDKDSEGLIFLTNDGNIVNKILRAGNNHEKEYIVSTEQGITPEFIQKMGSGVRIADGKTKPCKVTQLGKNSFRIILVQGLHRQIRRMCQALDFRVVHLKRVRIMNVLLGKMPLGSWRHLTPEEITLINKMVSESSGTEEASKPVRRIIPEKKEIVAPKVEKKAEKKAGSEKKKVPKKTSYKDWRKQGKK